MAGLTLHVQDDGTGTKYDLPAPTKAGSEAPATPTAAKANGQAPEEEARWARVGWAPQFGLPGHMDEDEGTMLDHQTWLEGRLEDKFYGGS